MREKLTYMLYRGFFTGLALLPMPVLYGISNGVRVLLQHGLK